MYKYDARIWFRLISYRITMLDITNSRDVGFEVTVSYYATFPL